MEASLCDACRKEYHLKLVALSHYDGDTDTRFGDCILLHDVRSLVVYDCGHERHTEEVKRFLLAHPAISQVHIVISHNDSDHTDGVCPLLEWLSSEGRYTVRVYTHQYLRHVDTILDKVADGRRSRERMKEALLKEFDNIRAIIETTKDFGFEAIEALPETSVGSCEIVGPTIDQFTDVAAQAVDNRIDNHIGGSKEGETVMNAASVQLKCTLENGEHVLLCGDAAPIYLNDLDSYDIIQLPHHGQLDDAQAIFDDLQDPYTKTFFISDNTGSGKTSGGSDKLKGFMKEENYTEALNTQNGVVTLPKEKVRGSRGVILGALDCKH